MSIMYLFRGVSATGKTVITNELSKIYGLPVLRKDDIYDSINIELSHSQKTKISYDVLAKIIQTNLDLGNDIIVDIALPHRPYIEEFLGKIGFDNNKLISFFCICSDHDEWKRRWTERMKNPAPNQLFISLDEVDNYYKDFDFTLLDGEIIVDSVNDVQSILCDVAKYWEEK